MQPDNWTFTFDVHREKGKQYPAYVYLAGVSGFLFCGICGVLNILTLIMYHRGKNVGLSATANRSEQERKVESRLTVYAFITFAVQFCMSLLMIAFYIASSSPVPFLNTTIFLALANQSVWIGDMCTIVFPAWCLLWASTKALPDFNEAVAKRKRLKKKGKGQTQYKRIGAHSLCSK
ncbi:serpentine type 7TM GPCR chemoreceptor srv domain-containing protein [Ditylenchus destructor]|nr:serpentine type 7TM GPCR chemoreceptor srv domain-containing protein [Ditylenchus destructor]